MINLLPPDIKKQVAYSKYNVIVRNYLALIILMSGLLGLTLYVSYSYGRSQLNAYEVRLQERQKEVAKHKQTEDAVKELEDQLKTIGQLYKEQTRFSELLNDLAAVLPSGSYINGINLTGDDKQPVQLLITASSISKAGVIKNALLKSPRIESVDIQGVSQNRDTGQYVVEVVMAFKEGAAR